jgi:hypothetical protein
MDIYFLSGRTAGGGHNFAGVDFGTIILKPYKVFIPDDKGVIHQVLGITPLIDDGIDIQTVTLYTFENADASEL